MRCSNCKYDQNEPLVPVFYTCTTCVEHDNQFKACKGCSYYHQCSRCLGKKRVKGGAIYFNCRLCFDDEKNSVKINKAELVGCTKCQDQNNRRLCTSCSQNQKCGQCDASKEIVPQLFKPIRLPRFGGFGGFGGQRDDEKHLEDERLLEETENTTQENLEDRELFIGAHLKKMANRVKSAVAGGLNMLNNLKKFDYFWCSDCSPDPYNNGGKMNNPVCTLCLPDRDNKFKTCKNCLGNQECKQCKSTMESNGNHVYFDCNSCSSDPFQNVLTNEDAFPLNSTAHLLLSGQYPNFLSDENFVSPTFYTAKLKDTFMQLSNAYVNTIGGNQIINHNIERNFSLVLNDTIFNSSAYMQTLAKVHRPNKKDEPPKLQIRDKVLSMDLFTKDINITQALQNNLNQDNYLREPDLKAQCSIYNKRQNPVSLENATVHIAEGENGIDLFETTKDVFFEIPKKDLIKINFPKNKNDLNPFLEFDSDVKNILLYNTKSEVVDFLTVELANYKLLDNKEAFEHFNVLEERVLKAASRISFAIFGLSCVALRFF